MRLAMIAIEKIKDKYRLRFDNLLVDLGQDEIIELRKLCHLAINDHVICRACGVGGLKWKQVDDKWLLFVDNQLHDCPVKPLPELVQDPDKCDWI
jgi:hypothetical protein